MWLIPFRYNREMDTIPDELLERWAERDGEEPSPKIASITLDEYDSTPPQLDYLEEPEKPPRRFHVVESSPPVPSSSAVKLHGTKAAGLGVISIASYVPKRISTTKGH
jgi:hypothetical protein